ncbi:MAG TPA: hypothetical protein VD905_15510 [Flavobacteriales bacterium]|nr:hypothetical protein [Flavobacteriales bacterium]
MKLLKKILSLRNALIVALLLLVAQLIAKFWLGLGAIPVYLESETYEYMYAPNQDLYRFGNHVVTNSFGMRSPEPETGDVVRILKIGDSVINGGPHVDQDNLSSTILKKELQKVFHQKIGVYNISAQSWGPDNAFAFIKKHGHFNAGIFMLVFSSHDLHDNMHFKKVVGTHKAWPDVQPLCALTDAWSRYTWPKIKSLFGSESEEYDYLYGFDDSKRNPGWEQFFQYCNKNKIKLLVYVHATKSELKNQSYDKYGMDLLTLLDSNKVKYIKGIECIKDPAAYRDEIHLNAKGHDLLAKTLFPYLKTQVYELLPK